METVIPGPFVVAEPFALVGAAALEVAPLLEATGAAPPLHFNL